MGPDGATGDSSSPLPPAILRLPLLVVKLCGVLGPFFPPGTFDTPSVDDAADSGGPSVAALTGFALTLVFACVLGGFLTIAPGNKGFVEACSGGKSDSARPEGASE